MNIGEAAAASGLPAKTIRYYEEIGLIRPKRDSNGYRAFAEDDVHRLAFLNRSRGLGFSIEDCRALLGLYADDTRASEDVKRLAADHLTRIDARIAELQALRATVAGLVDACAGDGRPDCPILEDLATGPLCAHQKPKPLA
ncbi:Cu(I)-responsive transcriptional regulator [Pararhodobacter zhoushanensis]|uniref:Cu(I)-responsive transcriptional regulator n=1 Tax=Pararhodobacter zhoushanensis TaxID=2479545 RepID=A0ABT3GXA1_9RHOB|nr:Cu(I)-responsive transcriptional regulator [Pararhodobacter zhoushanensis]MCW1404177.1 Cu(I)-responsive transcriptional regulator [Novosphingobium sp. MW5]MCW1932147.1 Cu(I)-responsive transcriptional regulator [Pararhodobacter zhoushanensis]